MCGRFTNRLTWREIVALYRLTAPATIERNLPARYNICPITTIDAVIERDAKRELVPMRWGLVPSWWKKKAKETPATFNARAGTVAEKPMFRSAFKRTRCLIPASGYYEWQGTPTGKQPYYYTARDGSHPTIAGLWDEWKDIETGEPLKSCTMIITNANDLATRIHDGLPVLLRPKDFDGWLAGTAGTDLLRPAANDYWLRGQFPAVRLRPQNPAIFDFNGLIKRFRRVEDFGEIQADYKNWTFWTYARRAAAVFGALGKPIAGQLKRHRQNIRRRAENEISKAVSRR